MSHICEFASQPIESEKVLQESQSAFCCVTLKHQSTHLDWSTGFINMLLRSVTDAPFTSWDPTGLISLYSPFNSTHLSIFLLPYPIFFSLVPLFSPFSLPLSPPTPNVSFKSTKKCLIVMQATETAAPMQSDVPAIHLKLHVRSFGLTLALRALTQREMRMDERVEVRCSARGHFKRTHGLCWSLWVSWRSNQRLFSFKKGYFTDRLACSEVVNYHAREGNPGSYSNHCTWEALIDRTDPDTQRALGSVHIAREIT